MVGDIYKTSFNPDKIALNYKGNSITYGQLDQKVLSICRLFKKGRIERRG